MKINTILFIYFVFQKDFSKNNKRREARCRSPQLLQNRPDWRRGDFIPKTNN
jgi:hypothetical protein